VTTGPRQSGDGTVAKALTVLDAVAEHGRPVRFTELLEDSPFPKATLYRFVQTLTAPGHAELRPRAPDLCAGPAARPAGPRGVAGLVAGAHRAALSRRSSVAPPGKRCTWRSSMAGRCFMWTSATRRPGRDVFAGRQGRAGLLHRRGQGDAGLPARGGACPGLQRQAWHPLHAQDDHRPPRTCAPNSPRSARVAMPSTTRNTSPASSASRCRSCSRRGRVLGAVSVTSTTARTDLAG
jgi:IclR family KDG regulon transcriptional repressor